MPDDRAGADAMLEACWSDVITLTSYWCPIIKYDDLKPMQDQISKMTWPLAVADAKIGSVREPSNTLMSRAVAQLAGTSADNLKDYSDRVIQYFKPYYQDGETDGSRRIPFRVALVEGAFDEEWERSLGLRPAERTQLSFGFWISQGSTWDGLIGEMGLIPEVNICKDYPRGELAAAEWLEILERFGKAMIQQSILFVTTHRGGSKRHWIYRRESWDWAHRKGQGGFVLDPPWPPTGVMTWYLRTCDRRDWLAQFDVFLNRFRGDVPEKAVRKHFNRAVRRADLGGTFLDGTVGSSPATLHIWNYGGAAFLFSPLFWNEENRRAPSPLGPHLLGDLIDANNPGFAAPPKLRGVPPRPIRLLKIAQHDNASRERDVLFRLPGADDHPPLPKCSRDHSDPADPANWPRDGEHQSWDGTLDVAIPWRKDFFNH